MPSRRPLKLYVTERFVHDPEAVERGLQAWVAFLGEADRRRLLAGDTVEPGRDPTRD